MDELRHLTERMDGTFADLTQMIVVERDARRAAEARMQKAVEELTAGMRDLGASSERLETILLQGLGSASGT